MEGIILVPQKDVMQAILDYMKGDVFKELIKENSKDYNCGIIGGMALAGCIIGGFPDTWILPVPKKEETVEEPKVEVAPYDPV